MHMYTFESLQKDIKKIKEIIKHDFSEENLLLKALTHRSFTNEQRRPGLENLENNERLEFLGDSVLGLCASSFLYKKFPEVSEGVLSQLRSRLVDVDACASYVEKLGLHSYILLGKGEERNEGRNKTSILANVFEAIIGAIFLDGGFASATMFLERHFLEDMETLLASPSENYKAELQDYSQKKHQKPPVYKIFKEEGPDHAKTFFAHVYVREELLGEGSGFSKKDAEQDAAKSALSRLKDGQGCEA